MVVGVPVGQGYGEDEVVVFGIAGGGGIGGGGADLEAEEFLEEEMGAGDGGGDVEAVELESEGEGGDEVGAGDAEVSMGRGELLAGGDDDGDETDREAGFAEEVNDGRAEPGGVDDEGALGVDFGAGDDFGDPIDDDGIGQAEREALEVADLEGPGVRVGEGDRVTGAEGFDALEDGEGGMIGEFAEVEPADERVARDWGEWKMMFDECVDHGIPDFMVPGCCDEFGNPKIGRAHV